MGFRWDFLIYSALPIVTSCYFLFREEYRDVMYTWLLNIYIAANAFWILCMYAAFSNRFAQLSWFLMGFVFIYPFSSRGSGRTRKRNWPALSRWFTPSPFT